MNKDELRQAINFVLNIRKAYRYYNNAVCNSEYADGIDEQVRDICGDILGSPMTDVGTALRLVNKYNLKMYVGMCYSDCQVHLERKDWDSPIRLSMKSSKFGSWLEDQPHENITSIYGYGKSINEAVCRCLINCNIAGVLMKGQGDGRYDKREASTSN